jgi:hypothetical protein
VGHSTLAMTQRNAHVQEPMLEDAAARMAAFFGGLETDASTPYHYPIG